MNDDRRPRPRTGQRRKTRQPFSIDKLAPEVGETICKLRREGKTWQQIEELSPQFAGRRLPHSSIHRWYDVQVAQIAPLPADLERLATLISDRVVAQLRDLFQRRAA